MSRKITRATDIFYPKLEQPAFTIDDSLKNAKDDALSITPLENGNVQLNCFITNPIEYFNYVPHYYESIYQEPFSQVIKQNRHLKPNARKRLSLEKAQTCRVFNYCFIFNKQGTLLDYSISLNRVLIRENYTHNQLSTVHKIEELGLKEELLAIKNILQGNSVDYEPNFSHLLVMLAIELSNSLLAEYFRKHDLPGIFTEQTQKNSYRPTDKPTFKAVASRPLRDAYSLMNNRILFDHLCHNLDDADKKYYSQEIEKILSYKKTAD